MQYAVLVVSMSTKGHRVSQINASRGPTNNKNELTSYLSVGIKHNPHWFWGPLVFTCILSLNTSESFFLILSYWFLKQIDVSEYNRILKVSLLEMYPFLRSLEKRKVRTTLALLTYPQASRSLWNFIVKKWERGRYCIISPCVWGMFTKTDLTDTFIVV